MRNLDHDEPRGWIKIILSAFVDDPNVSLSCGLVILDHLVDSGRIRREVGEDGLRRYF